MQAATHLAYRVHNAIRLLAGQPVKQAAPGTKRQDDYNLYQTLYRFCASLWLDGDPLPRGADLGSRRRNRRFPHRLGAADSAIGGAAVAGQELFVLQGGERRAIGAS